jgi:hypothetical protein
LNRIAHHDGSGWVDPTGVSLTLTNSGNNSVTGMPAGFFNPGGVSVTAGFSGTPGHLFYICLVLQFNWSNK